MRTYDDTFSGTKIYPGKVSQSPMRQDYRSAGREQIVAMKDFKNRMLTVG